MTAKSCSVRTWLLKWCAVYYQGKCRDCPMKVPCAVWLDIQTIMLDDIEA